MNDIRDYSIQTYEKQISHDYYYQIVTHEIYDVAFIPSLLHQNNIGVTYART
jgi:hypothetical protein